MKKILSSNKRTLTAFLVLGFVLATTSCRRTRYVCECYSKIKGNVDHELGEVKKTKAEDECNYIYVHLKSTEDTSLYCQLITPYERN
jgi:hypothetical protein